MGQLLKVGLISSSMPDGYSRVVSPRTVSARKYDFPKWISSLNPDLMGRHCQNSQNTDGCCRQQKQPLQLHLNFFSQPYPAASKKKKAHNVTKAQRNMEIFSVLFSAIFRIETESAFSGRRMVILSAVILTFTVELVST